MEFGSGQGTKDCDVSETTGKSGASGGAGRLSKDTEHSPPSLLFLGDILAEAGASRRTIDLVIGSWRPGTRKLYTNYLHKWVTYCTLWGKSVLQPSIFDVADFLADLSDKGLGYGALNTCRSALGVTSHALFVTYLPSELRFNLYHMRYRPPKFTENGKKIEIFQMFKFAL